MSNINRREAHMRHAQRAGGFGNFFSFPFDTTTDTTTTSASETSTTGLSLGLTIPLSIPTSSSQEPSSSSTTTSSSSSSSSPSSTITSSATSQSASTTFTGSALGHQGLTKVVTQNVIETAQGSAASASTTPTSSGALVAPVLGGVAGGIIGLALLIFLVTFFIRRRGNRDDEAINFDPGSFRRSAMMLNDPPTHQDTVARGYNPPPTPQMVQTRPAYATQPNYDFGVTSPNSANPLVFEAPFSPISPNMTSTPVIQQPFAPVVLTRNPSATSSHSAHGPAQFTGPRTSGQLAPEYVDMERTSVTPFQAAQYAEISQRLNADMPKGLDTPAVEEFVNNMPPATPTKQSDLPPVPQDPFEDGQEVSVKDLAFPAPPSPVATSASRYRVEASPPTLPEIVVQSRVSVGFSDKDATPLASGFPSGQTIVMKGDESPMGGRFPVTPSPLASSFSVVTPPASQSSFPAAPEPAAATKKPATRPETVYDPEDAYGGF